MNTEKSLIDLKSKFLSEINQIPNKGLIPGSIYEEVEVIRNNFLLKLPEKPKKPFLPTKHTVEDVNKYAESLKKYEQQSAEYENTKNHVQASNEVINDAYIEAMQKISGYTGLSQKQKDIISGMMYERYSNDLGYGAKYFEAVEDFIEKFKDFSKSD